MSSEAQSMNSAMKSRSDTASRLLSEMSVNPSSAARKSRSMPNAWPASAPLPSGSTLRRGSWSASRCLCVQRRAAWVKGKLMQKAKTGSRP